MTDQRPAVTNARVAKLLRRDLKRCVELEKLVFAGDDPWSLVAFRSELDQGHFYVGCYDEAENLLGYGGLALIADPPDAEAEIHTLAVDPDYQGNGFGRKLLAALLARADEYAAVVLLEVRTDNDAAIALYQGHGFEVVGVRKRYYQPSGADAYTMRRPGKSTVERGGAV